MKASETAGDLAGSARQLGHDVAKFFGTGDDSPAVALWEAADALERAEAALASAGK